MGEGGVKIWSKFANGYLDKTADIGEGGVKNPEKIADVFYRRSLRSSQLPLELLFEWARFCRQQTTLILNGSQVKSLIQKIKDKTLLIRTRHPQGVCTQQIIDHLKSAESCSFSKITPILSNLFVCLIILLKDTCINFLSPFYFPKYNYCHLIHIRFLMSLSPW